MNPDGQHLQIALDVTAGYVLARVLLLVVMKAFIEPLAARWGQDAYRRVDAAAGDRLPDLFPTRKP